MSSRKSWLVVVELCPIPWFFVNTPFPEYGSVGFDVWSPWWLWTAVSAKNAWAGPDHVSTATHSRGIPSNRGMMFIVVSYGDRSPWRVHRRVPDCWLYAFRRMPTDRRTGARPARP